MRIPGRRSTSRRLAGSSLSQPPRSLEIELPPTPEEITEIAPDSTTGRLLTRFRLETLLYWLAPFAIVGLGSLLYFAWIERWLYLRLSPAAAVEKIYRRLYRVGRPLAGGRTNAETAYEYMQKLINAIQTIRERSRFTTYLSKASQDIQFLTDIYQAALFAHHTLNKDDIRTTLNTWKRLRVLLYLARVNSALNLVRLSPVTRPIEQSG